VGTARVILLEGLIGAGKTTTAGQIAQWLTGRGENARAYPEFAEDHPIRSRAVDLLRADYAGSKTSEEDPDVYPEDQWGRLARQCVQVGQTVVLESTFLQNTLLPLFVGGAPVDAVKDAFARIERQLAPAEPLLIHLRPTDIAAAIARVHAERGEAWAAWNMSSVADYPWTRSRNLRGREAVVELYHAWESVVDELSELHPFGKLLVLDPQDDRGRAFQLIRDVVRPK
jgi:predicted kinase